MSLVLTKLKVYARVAILVAVTAAIVAVLFKNRDHNVPIWFFGLIDENAPVNVVWLMLCTAVVSLVCFWLLSFSWSLWRDMRHVREESAKKRAAQEHKQREAELTERERRIDDKLRNALTDEPPKEDET